MGTQCNIFVDLGNDVTIQIGDGIQLNFSTNAIVDTIIWSPLEGLSCGDCPAPFARPTTRSTYRVTLVDEEGCIVNDDIVISVDQSRNVYIPNVFRPMGMG
ncbi:MAG: hypothetical protein R2795_22800 [Saprospiraceae bacterium]